MITAPFAANSDTSREAAESVENQLQRLERLVLDAICASGPAGITCDAIEMLTGLSHQTASARVNALRNSGLILDKGTRAKTRSGRNATLWIAKSLAQAA